MAVHDVALHRSPVPHLPLEDLVAHPSHPVGEEPEQVDALAAIDRGHGDVVPHLDLGGVDLFDSGQVDALDGVEEPIEQRRRLRTG